MKVRFTFICDYAQESGKGKISALGIGINNFNIDNLSLPIQPFCLVVSVEGWRTEAGEKRMEVHLIDADGKPVIEPVTGTLLLEAPPNGLKLGARMIFNFGGIKFKQYEEYSLSIIMDGHELDSIPLVVSQSS